MDKREFNSDQRALLALGFTKCEVRRISDGIRDLKRFLETNHNSTEWDKQRTRDTLRNLKGYDKRITGMEKNLPRAKQVISMMRTFTLSVDTKLKEEGRNDQR